jgi:hypothetical protein
MVAVLSVDTRYESASRPGESHRHQWLFMVTSKKVYQSYLPHSD